MPRWVLVNTRTVANLFQALETLGHVQVDGETGFSQSRYNVRGAKIVCRVKIMILVFSAEIRDIRIWVTFPLFQMMATVQKNRRGLGSRKT